MLSPQNAISTQVQVWEEQEFSFTFSGLPFFAPMGLGPREQDCEVHSWGHSVILDWDGGGLGGLQFSFPQDQLGSRV